MPGILKMNDATSWQEKGSLYSQIKREFGYSLGTVEIMAERQGFEPWIPVSQYTRLAGERLRPTRPSLRVWQQTSETAERNIYHAP